MRNILLLLLLLSAAGCPDIDSIPEIPEIEFRSFELSEQTDELGNRVIAGNLNFRFQDGDGDIGYSQDTLFYQDSSLFNLFFTLYEKSGGAYLEVPDTSLPAPLNYRIPYMETEGNNRTLKGEIDVVFEYLTIEYDTIRYTFFITDRAGHKSNVDTTTDIGFTEWRD